MFTFKGTSKNPIAVIPSHACLPDRQEGISYNELKSFDYKDSPFQGNDDSGFSGAPIGSNHLKKSVFRFYSTFRYFKLFIVLLAIGILTGCDTDDEAIEKIKEENQENRLESATLIAEFSAPTLQSFAQLAGQEAIKERFKYDIEVYKVTYHTQYKGDELLVSGLVCLPVGIAEAVSVLSVQHGTLYEHKDAPSLYKNNFLGIEPLASLGYVTAIPDYIGYGASSDQLHPYYNFEYTSRTIIDMILAAKELAANKKLALSDELFLIGYSEGGYATLAAHKAIQQDPDTKLKVTASVAGAGGYDLTGVMDTIFTSTTYPHPDYLAFIIYSYIVTLDWEKPLSYFFQEPYAGRIPALFDGEHTSGEIIAQLNTDLSALFTPAFLNRLNDGSNVLLEKALKSNSLNRWVPSSPVQLYHGNKDFLVPFSDSKLTYQAFLSAGAANVEFIPIDGADHSTGLLPMIEGAVPFFLSFE